MNSLSTRSFSSTSNDDTPGPGAYDPQDISHVIPTSIRSRPSTRSYNSVDPHYRDIRSFPTISRKTIGPAVPSNLWAHDDSIPGPVDIMHSGDLSA